jgi:hypothetical protein
MATTTPILILHTGKTALPLKMLQANTIQAKAGEHYRIVKRIDGKDTLLDNVLAKRTGDHLLLAYADGTQVTVENYYVECKGAVGCDLTLPAKGGTETLLSAESSAGASLGDNSTLVYAHGDQGTLMAMAQDNGALQSTLASIDGSELSYLPGQHHAGCHDTGWRCRFGNTLPAGRWTGSCSGRRRWWWRCQRGTGCRRCSQ